MYKDTENLESLTKQTLDINKYDIDKLSSETPKNKAELLKLEDRKKIAKFVVDVYKKDLESISERLEQWDNVMRDVKNDIPTKSEIDENKTSENYPLVAIAAKKFASEAYPLLLQNGNLVKAKVIGYDGGEEVGEIVPGEGKLIGDDGKPIERIPAGKKASSGERRAMFDNFIINNNIKNYEETTDVLLNMLPLFGTFFTKIKYNQFKGEIEREYIYPSNLIVNNWAIDDEYAFYSQILNINYNDVLANINNGLFLKEYVEVRTVMEDNNYESNLDSVRYDSNSNYNIFECSKVFIEQHNWIDLDGDGFLEPYICIVHKDSEQLMAIYSRYDTESIKTAEDSDTIVDIKPSCFFVKYIFEPSYDGSFYGEGFGSLLHKTNAQVNSLLNQLIDAGVLSTNVQGFISDSLKIRNGDADLQIGSLKVVNDEIKRLDEGIYRFVFPEPSQILFLLMQYLIDNSQTLAGFYTINQENLAPNTSPTTVMAFLEQGSRQFKAIYKRIYRSLKKEIEIIENIIRLDIDKVFSSKYKNVLDYSEKESQNISFEEDYNNKSFNIIPVADSEIITSHEKIARSQMLVSLLENPAFQGLLNPEVILRDILETMQVPNYDKFIVKQEQNQPSVQEQMMAQQQQIIQQQQQLEQQRIDIANREVARKEAEGAIKAMSVDIEKDKKEAETEKIRAETIKTLAETQKTTTEINNLRNNADELYEPTNNVQ